jgi:hypothetical protein
MVADDLAMAAAEKKIGKDRQAMSKAFFQCQSLLE